MAHGKLQEDMTKEQLEEMTEETFLKDLYLFMKNRDTPIERIPHLGFKQIDLFIMYKTVNEFGGYHQVTAQQLWKQVYNTLGGNPRSTSAATCTRRHYEKLLLPYECHKKGELLSALPHHQPKHFHYNFSKDDDGQRPAKRKPLPLPLRQEEPRSEMLREVSCGRTKTLSVTELDFRKRKEEKKSYTKPLCQKKNAVPRVERPAADRVKSSHNLLSDPHVRVIPLPVQYSHYYHLSHPLLPPCVPISSSGATTHGASVPQPHMSYHPTLQSSTDRIKQPLEHLRYLAEQYKSSTGLSPEPLNLSFKASGPETNTHHASSFTPPPSGKNPKFLNKPSPLYPTKRMMRNEGCETQDNEEGLGKYLSVPPYSSKAREDNAINLKTTSTTSSSSPTSASDPTPRMENGSTPLVPSREGTSAMDHTPNSPNTDFTIWPREEREESPKLSQRALNLSHVSPSPPRENGGKMEIEIPLTLLHDWIRLCGPSATMHGVKLPSLPQEEDTRQKSYTPDIFPTNLTFHSHPRGQDRSAAREDLSPKQRNLPNPTPSSQANSDHHAPSHYGFSSFKPVPSGGALKDASSQNVYPWDQQDINNPYTSKPPNPWDPYDKDSQAPPGHQKINSSPLTVEEDFAGSKTSAYTEDIFQGGRDRSGKGPSAVLMVNSTSASVLHLTSEEVMKLKRIISSSS